MWNLESYAAKLSSYTNKASFGGWFKIIVSDSVQKYYLNVTSEFTLKYNHEFSLRDKNPWTLKRILRKQNKN